MKITKFLLLLVSISSLSIKAYTEEDKTEIRFLFESLKKRCLSRIDNRSDNELSSETGQEYVDCVLLNGPQYTCTKEKLAIFSKKNRSLYSAIPEVMAFNRALRHNVYWIYNLNEQAKIELEKILNEK